jgi:CHAT domain-containing protein
MARHLTEDDAAAFRQYARRAGAIPLISARVALSYAPTPYTPDFERIESALTPYIRLLVRALTTEFGIPSEERVLNAYLGMSLPERMKLMALNRRLFDLSSDHQAPLEERAAAFEKLIDELRPYRAMFNLGNAYAPYTEILPRLGRGEEMKDCLEQALRHTLEYGDTTLACQFLGMLGVIHGKAGNDSAMKACWDAAIVMARQIGSWHEARILNFYALYYRSLGDEAAATDLICRAEARCRELGADEAEIRFLHDKLELFASMSAWDLVERDLERAEVLQRRGMNKWSRADAITWSVRMNVLRMRLHSFRGNDRRAAALARRVLKDVESWPVHPKRELAVLWAASILTDSGRAREALPIIAGSIERCRQFEMPELVWDFHLEGARASIEIGDVTGCGRELEQLRPRILTSGFFDANRTRYDVLEIRRALAAGDRRTAEVVLERALQHVEKHRDGFCSSPEAYLRMGHVESLRWLFHDLWPADAVAGYAFEIAWSRLKSGSELSPEDWPSSVLRSAVSGTVSQPFDLPDDAVHHVFSRRDDSVTRWTRSHDQVSRQVVAMGARTLERHATDVLSAVSHDHRAIDRANIRRLHELASFLLPEAGRTDSRIRTVYLTVDGFLSRVPFEALNLDAEDYEPLLYKYDVAYIHPSASVRRRDEVNSPLQKTAGPDLTLVVSNPSYPLELQRRLSILNEPLPFSLIEATSFHDARGERVLLRGAAANRSRLLESWELARSLYFATHFVTHPELPYITMIPLAADSCGSAHVDMKDIRGADLRSCELVVLSGCGSGVRFPAGANELPSLGELFVEAGAAAVVQTGWSVGDQESSLLMHEFNGRFVADPENPVRALCQARRELMRKDHSPRLWAAYSIVLPGPPARPTSGEGVERSWIAAR